MNDVILNWKKDKKFINSEKTDNQCDGKDRATFMRKYERFQVLVNNELELSF